MVHTGLRRTSFALATLGTAAALASACGGASSAKNGDAAGAGGAAGGQAGVGAGGSGGAPVTQPLPHHPGSCTDLAAVGVWEHVTPAAVSLDPSFDTPAGLNFGVHQLALNPQDSAELILGTSAQGLYKTTDCGSSWVHVNTGVNGDKLDQGRQWTLVIDREDPRVIYTNSGYSPNGSIAWKSTDGGVGWQPFVGPDDIKALQFGNFVGGIAMDPTDHLHLLVTPHFECEIGAVNGLPKTKNCVLETKDAGVTWSIIDGTPALGEGSGVWMANATTWYWSEYFGGLFRTTDAGKTWKHVYDRGYADPGGYDAGGGKHYTGAEFNLLVSVDDGLTWSILPNSPGASFVTGDEKKIFVSRGTSYNYAPANDPSTSTAISPPDFTKPDAVRGWGIRYDPDHHLL
jgi:hypothetical protein